MYNKELKQKYISERSKIYIDFPKVAVPIFEKLYEQEISLGCDAYCFERSDIMSFLMP